MTLSEDFVQKQKWALADILTSSSSAPFQKVNGQAYFIDADPASFRLILEVLKGKITLDLNKLSAADIVVLRSTADYLKCSEIIEAIDQYWKTNESLNGEKDQKFRDLQAEFEQYRNQKGEEIQSLHRDLAKRNPIDEFFATMAKSWNNMCTNCSAFFTNLGRPH